MINHPWLGMVNIPTSPNSPWWFSWGLWHCCTFQVHLSRAPGCSKRGCHARCRGPVDRKKLEKLRKPQRNGFRGSNKICVSSKDDHHITIISPSYHHHITIISPSYHHETAIKSPLWMNLHAACDTGSSKHCKACWAWWLPYELMHFLLLTHPKYID